MISDSIRLNHSLRRQKLCQLMQPNSIAIVPATKVTFRNSDVEQAWRQDSNYDYLTGIPEADGIAIISNVDEAELRVFCHQKNPAVEVWNGDYIGTDNMVKQYGATESFDLADLTQKMPLILENILYIYYDWGNDVDLDIQLHQWLSLVQKKSRLGISAPQTIHFLRPLLGELRLFKDKNEIKILQKAAKISVEAHKQAMKKALKTSNEHSVASWLEYSMFAQGAERTAFGSIVATGKNCCTLHYRQNNADYQAGELMLIDAGAEYQGYASDITTVFPVNGKFSQAQRTIYEAVLDTQQFVLSQCKPNLDFEKLQQAAIQRITEHLVKLGLLQGEVKDNIENKRYKKYYMHSIGHWLGRDVHDIGDYVQKSKWRKLKENMVLTIEPGIYIKDDAPTEYNNIGVRIEDTIVITKTGYHNLTADLPRSVLEIEFFLANNG